MKGMVWTIAKKELRLLLLTYRFIVGLVLCVVSVSAGTLSVIEDVNSRSAAFRRALDEFQESLSREVPLAESVFNLYAFRSPRQLAVFSVGADRWQGNRVIATHHKVPYLPEWLGASNPYMVVFRSIDFTVVVQIVLGLMALLFAFDAISGEREAGTLRLIMSNPVARDHVLMGKALGQLLGLVAILSLCNAISLVLVQLSPKLHLSVEEVYRVITIFMTSILYVTSMYSIGLLLSTWTGRSSTAAFVAMFAWISSVVIYPNAVAYGVDRASSVRAESISAEQRSEQLNNAFSDEVEALARRILKSDNTYPGFGAGMQSNSFQRIRGYLWGTFPTTQKRLKVATGPDEVRQEALRTEDQEETTRRIALLGTYFGAIERHRVHYADRIWAETYEPLERRLRLASEWADFLVRLSPAGAYAQVAAVMARTDRNDYWNWLTSARNYRRQLIQHYEEAGWFEKRAWFNNQGEIEPSLESLPRFVEPTESFVQSLWRAAPGLGALCIFVAIASVVAYSCFLRCEV